MSQKTHQHHQFGRTVTAWLRHIADAVTEKTFKNQRGNGITGSNGMPLYIHVRAHAHHVKNACYACYAVTALICLKFSVTARNKCRYLPLPRGMACS